MSLAADAAAVILAARMAARVLQFFAGLLERTKSGLRERINWSSRNCCKKTAGKVSPTNAVAPRRAEWLQKQRQAGSVPKIALQVLK